MSHLSSSNTCKGEKTQSYASSQSQRVYVSNNPERYSRSHHDRDGHSSKDDVKHRHDIEHLRSVSSGSRHPEYQARESMNPAAASPHSAAVASAAAIYPRVAIVPQQGRAAGPPSHFEAFGLPTHLATNPTSSSGHPPSAVHSSAYRHLIPPSHALIPGQFSTSSGPPSLGLDIMWQQKLNPNPWLLAQYEELRLERDRSIAHERERALALERERERTGVQERVAPHERERTIIHDRERDREHERMERQKDERNDKERQRDWQEQEKLEREEKERAQIEAVQQHFEQSLRLALQKQQQKQGWNPVPNKNIGKSQESSISNLQSTMRNDERLRDQEKERAHYMDSNHARREHERWMAMVQQQRNEQTTVSLLQNFPNEARSSRITSKTEASQMPGQVPKSSLAPSPVSSSASQLRSDNSFSLYGYQPFQHTYITQAQLKAREESKASSAASVRISSTGQIKSNLPTKAEKDAFIERPLTPGSSHGGSSSKHQMKMLHAGQERGIMYQPLVGSGGAFKPYEYSGSSSSSPAPPAHQNTSPGVGRISAAHYQQLQDQPQNLVKGDGKGLQDKKYEARDSKVMVCTANSLNPRFSPPYATSKSTSPAASTPYSYSLIQQGLVPNPMYIATTHTGNNINSSAAPATHVHTQPSSKASTRPVSPLTSQQYPHASPNSAISSSSVCRPNSVPYTIPPTRINRSYSPSGPHTSLPGTATSGKLVTQDSLLTNRSHLSVQGSSHRSPSPAHLYGTQSNPGAPNSPHQSSPRLTPATSHPSVHLPMSSASSPYHTTSHLENPEASGVLLVKRKLLNEVSTRKRPKSIDDGLLPPQLHPQIQTSCIDNNDNQIIAPPHLVSNAPILAKHHLSTDSFSGKSNPSSPAIPSNLMYKAESDATPPPMPDLRNSPMALVESLPELDQPVDMQNYLSGLSKYKLPNKSTGNIAEEFADSLTSKNTTDKPQSDSNEEQSSTSVNVTSANSANNSNSSSSFHPKLKKAWLQRHSENVDKQSPNESFSDIKVDVSNVKTEPIETFSIRCKPEPYVLIENSNICDKYIAEVKIKASMENDDSFENKNLKCESMPEEDSSSSGSDIDSVVKTGKRKGKSKSKSSKKSKTGSNTDGISDDQVSSPKKERESKRKDSRKRGRKNKGRNVVLDETSKKKGLSKTVAVVKPPERPSIAQLKKTGEPFLQDGPCCEVAPRLPKCRECRMTPHQRSKKMPNIFCRFYAYRKLRYGKNGTILSAGFSEPADALEEDLKLWLPPIDTAPHDNEIEISKFLLTHVGDQFCDLVEMEREAQKLHTSIDGTITWKRVVQGVREMCDVCETTLFNIHWVCHKCGFVVCIDCYKSRKNGMSKDESSSKDRDDYQWLLCSNRQPHEQEKLMLTQIIAGTALWDVGKALHEIRRKWNIPTYCTCGIYDSDQDSKSSSNGICKLMSAVTKCFSSDKDSSWDANGSSDYQRSSKRSNKSSVNGMVKQEDGLGGYSSESGGSPLSWLADVALNSSSKTSDDQQDKDDEEKLSDDQESNPDASIESDDEKNENFSTLRELLIRPTNKMGGKSSSSSQKTLTSTLDEVISCVIEQKVRKSDKRCNEKQLLHFTRRYEKPKTGRDLPPVRACMLAESSLLYPEIPHVWLGTGKILLLKDPYHSGNLQLFQEQWKRGQPVIVSDVGKNLESSLWTPESFLKEFGDFKTDFYNYRCGTVMPNQPMKKFWEGFENVNKRMKDEDGESLVLKLVEWPSSEEFSDILPSRYDDLMKVLPLHQYTHREGTLNMASRLPECFVQPDLGPRMYNAYGISSSFGKGSTNLHLNISDVVNVLAYVATPRDGKDDTCSEIIKALEDCGCDSLMKKRAKEKGSKPGAVWHVYNARDADKIRDFLNKVSEEQGVKLNPHHDPIHNQEWYLDEKLRQRLLKEYGVEAYTIAQCFGDAIFIPAGSPHQVINLCSCVKISEDFVSPESVGHSFFLTQEIRNLSDSLINNEDRLQIKNIIYHAVKDALALLQSNDPEDPKT